MLAKIIAQKEKEVKLLHKTVSKLDIAPLSFDRVNTLLNRPTGKVEIIAELKKASPVKGVLNDKLNLEETAQIYADSGAIAVSVITDKTFFKGEPSFLPRVKSHIDIPILRKDFIIDEIQLYETHALGADLVLLIASILPYEKLLNLIEKSQRLGIEPLVEIHTAEEAKMVEDLPIRIIGINNRNLHDFSVDTNHSIKLANLIAENIFKVSASSISSPQDLALLERYDFNAALIGESLVSHPCPQLKLRELLNYRGGAYG